ncbi:MAG: sulfatase-like hydrolase/transferase [Magnetococcales bacterium]|nr:sulfatase-like hydrolase/transferase [Magnetococcales bacterium]
MIIDTESRQSEWRFFAATLAAMVLLWSLTRLGLAGWVKVVDPAAPLPHLLLAMGLGAAMDLATAVAFITPWWLGFLALGRFRGRTGFTRFFHFMVWAVWTALAFNVVSTLLFWNEFDSLYNGIAVNYLIFPKEVIGNIQESFNAAAWMPFFALAGWGALRWMRPRTLPLLKGPGLPGWRWRGLALWAGSMVLAVPLLMLGPVEFTPHREVQQIADNPLRTLVKAALTNDTELDGLFPTLDEREARRLARKTVQQDNTRFLEPEENGTLLRRVDNGPPEKAKRLNILLVIEESYGSIYMDNLDNDQPYPISPELVKLSGESAFFTNIYATGDRTVRGLEALLTSFTPIPGIATARRPGFEGMHSLPALLKKMGYGSAFLYGGLAMFDNMGPFWRGIGFDEVWDQTDIAEPGFTTAWGVADEFLFTEALKRMDAKAREKRPFFMAMLTVSNHRPYKFPENNVKWNDQKDGRENAATYAAWAFTDFVRRAKDHPWFDDTVFVFIGDHGPKISGAAEVPVQGFRVPLILHSPKHIPAQRFDAFGSSLDMAPTLLGLLGMSYDSPFFGVDLLRARPEGERFTMAHNFNIAYGRNGKVTVISPGGSRQGGPKIKGYRLPEGRHKRDAPLPPATPDPEITQEAIGVVQFAHRLFYGHKYHEKAP